MRWGSRGAALLVAAVVLGGLLSAGPAQSHGAVPWCEGDLTVEEVRGHQGQECLFHYQGLPIVAEGAFYTDHPNLRSNFHAGITALLADGTRQILPIECVDYGRPNDPMAECRVEWDPTGTGPHETAVPFLQDVVALICEAHSHAKESKYLNRYFGEEAGGWFRCSSGPAVDGGGGGGVGGVGGVGGGGIGGGSAAPGPPAFVAVPVNVFATDPAVVSKTAVEQAAPTYVNLDQNLHDVVALEAKHPDGSAPWCHGYEPGDCPLFWSPLIGPGETAAVSGFEGAAPGAYRFYCSIHPDMVGTVQVVA